MMFAHVYTTPQLNFKCSEKENLWLRFILDLLFFLTQQITHIKLCCTIFRVKNSKGTSKRRGS